MHISLFHVKKCQISLLYPEQITPCGALLHTCLMTTNVKGPSIMTAMRHVMQTVPNDVFDMFINVIIQIANDTHVRDGC